MTNSLNNGNYSRLSVDPTLGGMVDGVDFPHTGVFKALAIAAQGNFAILNAATNVEEENFSIVQTNSSGNTQFVVGSGMVMRDGKAILVPSNSATTTFTSGTPSTFDAPASTGNGYFLLVAKADNTLGIRDNGNRATLNTVPQLTAGDIPIAMIRLAHGETSDQRQIQYFTTAKSENSVSVGYNNSTAYTEALSIESSSDGDVTIESKVQDRDIIIKGNDGGSSTTIATVDVSAKVLIVPEAIYANRMQLGYGTGPAKLQVYNAGDNMLIYAAGDSGGNVTVIELDAGTDGVEANRIATISGHLHVSQNVGVGTTNPTAKLHITDSGSGDHLILEGTLGSSTTSAPNLVLFRNGADAAADIDDNDLIGQIVFRGENDNSTPQEVNYATIEAGMDDTTDGSEDGHITFNLIEDGTLTEFMRLRAATRDVVVNEQADDIDFRCEGSSDANLLFIDASADKVGIGLNAPKTKLTVEGAITLKEQVSADADTAAYGQLWTKTATPNELYFTNDAGNDIQLTTGAKGPLLQGKHTIWVPSSAMTPTTTAGCSDLTLVEMTAGRPELQVLDFAADADDHAQFTVAFPKSWDEGTVTFQPFWTVTGTNTGDVEWNLTGISMANSAVINTAYPSASVSAGVAHSGTSNDMNVGAVCGGLTITNAAVDTVTYFKLSNDTSSSTQTGVARLIGIKLFYTSNAGNDE